MHKKEEGKIILLLYNECKFQTKETNKSTISLIKNFYSTFK